MNHSLTQTSKMIEALEAKVQQHPKLRAVSKGQLQENCRLEKNLIECLELLKRLNALVEKEARTKES